MLRASVILFVLAIVAAILGFSGMAASAAGLAKTFALAFIVFAVVSFILSHTKTA
jgi:uncharacterized membrane protein YtjA (UPF0391 family)